jgi:fluoride exporter
MKSLLFISIGGFFGTALRFTLGLFLPYSSWPWSTFIVNMMGCFFMGLFIGMSQKYHFSDNIRLILCTGFCGGFTTFSALALENLSFIEKHNFLVSAFYILISVLIGTVLVYLGKWMLV